MFDTILSLDSTLRFPTESLKDANKEYLSFLCVMFLVWDMY